MQRHEIRLGKFSPEPSGVLTPNVVSVNPKSLKSNSELEKNQFRHNLVS